MTWAKTPQGETSPTEAFDKKYGSKVKGNSGGHGNWLKAIADCPDNKPFFLWLAALDAHRVWDGQHEWDETLYGPKYNPDSLTLPPALFDTPETRDDFAAYLLEVTRFDYFVGKVIDQLKADGTFENTYIFVLADNGRPFPRAKTRLIDDGMKTYFIATGPTIKSPGARSNSLISVIDIAPTVTELAGIEKPTTFQGRSIAPIYADATASIRPFAISEHNWHDYEAHGRSVRDGRWLFIRNFRPALALQGPADSCNSVTFEALLAASESSEPLAPAQADVFLAPRPVIEFYDTRSDPYQISNLAGNKTYADIEKKLSRRARQLDGQNRVTQFQTRSATTTSVASQVRNSDIEKEDFQRPPPGADRNADTVNAEGF